MFSRKTHDLNFLILCMGFTESAVSLVMGFFFFCPSLLSINLDLCRNREWGLELANKLMLLKLVDVSNRVYNTDPFNRCPHCSTNYISCTKSCLTSTYASINPLHNISESKFFFCLSAKWCCNLWLFTFDL